MHALHRKLLAHRVRGFPGGEHSRRALQAACSSGIPYVELDTRASRDGGLFVEHDAVAPGPGRRRVRVARSTAEHVRRRLRRGPDAVLEVPEALRIFATSAGEGSRLCLDLKDAGFEAEHLEAVRAAGLEERVVFVSWAPQVLIALARLGARSPLVLSHWNLMRLGGLGRLLDRAVRDRRMAAGRFVLLGHRGAARNLGPTCHGYQHGLVCRGLPRALSEPLARSGGGICVHRTMLSPSLAGLCRARGLQLWTFTTRGVNDFLRVASLDGVDVVFSEDAGAVSRALGALG